MTTMPSLKIFNESKWYKTLRLTVEFSEANISYNNKRLRDYISPYSKVKMGFVDNRKALPDLQLKNFDPYSSPRDDKSSVQASVDKKLPKEFDSALTSFEQKEAIGFFRK